MCLLLVAAVFLPVARLYILAGGKKKERVEGGKNGYEGEEGSAEGKKRKAPPCTVLCTRHSIPFPFLSLSLLPFLVRTHTSSAAPYPHPPFRGGGRGKGRKVEGGREDGLSYAGQRARKMGRKEEEGEVRYRVPKNPKNESTNAYVFLAPSFEIALSNQGHPVKGERGQKVLRRRGMGSRRGKKKKIKS